MEKKKQIENSIKFTFAKKKIIQANLSNWLWRSQVCMDGFTVFRRFEMLLPLLLNVERIIPFQKTNQGRENIARVESVGME